jgi:hypothetical protein
LCWLRLLKESLSLHVEWSVRIFNLMKKISPFPISLSFWNK